MRGVRVKEQKASLREVLFLYDHAGFKGESVCGPG